MTDNYDADMQNFIDQVSEKYIAVIRTERAESDQNHLMSIEAMLGSWADKITDATKEMVTAAQKEMQSDGEAVQFDGMIEDIKGRQEKMISSMKEAYTKQMEVLRAAISEERKEAAQAQSLFEQTLKTRYEAMVDALNEKIKAEQEARMKRALENLERSARVESERARQSFEIQQEAEATLAKKFKGIVADLRKSWEEEETGRANQLEERLRSHYSVVLEHMESQLKMALQLQDDADKHWLDDVEARNKQQLETLKAFEEKCKRLYDGRLAEYVDRVAEQVGQYEEQLLEAGNAMAVEKSQFESRLRRVKLSCSRWKVSYQKEVHERYQSMTGVLEERYMAELAELLEEISDVRSQLSDSHRQLEIKERELIQLQQMHDMEQQKEAAEAKAAGGGGGGGNGGSSLPSAARPASPDGSAMSHIMPASDMRARLMEQWNEQKTPVAERVDALVALLDAAKVTPSMLTAYEAVQEKLSDRLPISQMINRKQFIEYKLKLAARMGGEGGNLSSGDRALLITELTEIQSNLDVHVKRYEKKYGEPYVRPNDNMPASSGSSVPPSPAGRLGMGVSSTPNRAYSQKY